MITEKIEYPKLRLVWNLREYGKGIDGYLDFEKNGEDWLLVGDVSVTDVYSSYNLRFSKEDCVSISDFRMFLKELEEFGDFDDLESCDFWKIDRILQVIASVIEDKVKAEIAELYVCEWYDCDVNFSQLVENLEDYRIVE